MGVFWRKKFFGIIVFGLVKVFLFIVGVVGIFFLFSGDV